MQTERNHVFLKEGDTLQQDDLIFDYESSVWLSLHPSFYGLAITKDTKERFSRRQVQNPPQPRSKLMMMAGDIEEIACDDIFDRMVRDWIAEATQRIENQTDSPAAKLIKQL